MPQVAKVHGEMEKNAIIRQVILTWLQKTVDVSQKMVAAAFHHIKKFWEHDKKVKYLKRVDALVDVIEVMYCCSEKGNRTPSEKRCLHELLLGPNAPHSIFRKMSNDEIDKLFDEVDLHFSDERLILFLQGDKGDNSFIVITGSVNIYMEKSKELEQELLKKYKKKRDYEISEEACKELGVHIRSITTGNVFGDLSIESNKPRTYAAIAEPHSLLLLVDTDTYNTVIRPYRLSEEQLSIASGLLRENVLFSHYDEAKLLSIAYSLHYREVVPNTTIVSAGNPVRSVIIILSGEVKAYPFDSTDSRGPRLAVAQLGRGTIIGERELLKQSTRFHMTYITASTSRLFEMDAKTFQDNSCTDRMRGAERFKFAERAELAREEIYIQRLSSGRRVIDGFFASYDLEDNNDMNNNSPGPSLLSSNYLGSVGHHTIPTVTSIVRHATTNPRVTQILSLSHLSESSLNSPGRKDNGSPTASQSSGRSEGMVQLKKANSIRRLASIGGTPGSTGNSPLGDAEVKLGPKKRIFSQSKLDTMAISSSAFLANSGSSPVVLNVNNPYSTSTPILEERETTSSEDSTRRVSGGVGVAGTGGNGNMISSVYNSPLLNIGQQPPVAVLTNPSTSSTSSSSSSSAISTMKVYREIHKQDVRLIAESPSLKNQHIITPHLAPDQHTFSSYQQSHTLSHSNSSSSTGTSSKRGSQELGTINNRTALMRLDSLRNSSVSPAVAPAQTVSATIQLPPPLQNTGSRYNPSSAFLVNMSTPKRNSLVSLANRFKT